MLCDFFCWQHRDNYPAILLKHANAFVRLKARLPYTYIHIHIREDVSWLKHVNAFARLKARLPYTYYLHLSVRMLTTCDASRAVFCRRCIYVRTPPYCCAPVPPAGRYRLSAGIILLYSCNRRLQRRSFAQRCCCGQARLTRSSELHMYADSTVTLQARHTSAHDSAQRRPQPICCAAQPRLQSRRRCCCCSCCSCFLCTQHTRHHPPT